MSLRNLVNPTTIRRLPTLILPIHQRFLATKKPETPPPEVGPTAAPELQLNNLTGEHERKTNILCFERFQFVFTL